MSRLTLPAAAAAVALVAAACDQPQLLEPSASASVGAGSTSCLPTGMGLTAKVVNRDGIGGTIDVDSGVQYAVLVQGSRSRAAPGPR